MQCINRYNPDMITGYNIFGFDFDYINKRVKKFNKLKNPYKKPEKNRKSNKKRGKVILN